MMKKLEILFYNNIKIIGFFIALFGAYLLFQNFFEANIYPVPLNQPLWSNLDPSWSIALNYANLNNLAWGKDISFTYGPLAFLCTRICMGENKYIILFYDLFIVLNYFLIFYNSFKISKSKLITILSIISICIIFPVWSGYAGTLILMAFLIFWVRVSLDNYKVHYYLFQIAIVVLAFFIKFNTGLIAFPLFYSGILYNIVKRKVKLIYLIIYAVSPIILCLIYSSILNVSLISYLISGMQMISGYNEIMYLENTINKSIFHLILLILIALIVIIININVLEKKNWLKNGIILFLFGTSFFVLYKQTFTRADGHVYDFFIFVSILIICNIDLHINNKKWFTKLLFIIIIIIPFKFLVYDNDRKIQFSEKLPKSTYISGFKLFTQTSGNHLLPNTSELPLNILKKIGNKTVDIFPWNIQLLLLNKLNYLPRPVIQSYTAYTSYLENLNFEHYNSEKAPEFVIYDIASLDGRYAFFDESKVNLEFIKNYYITEKFDFDGRNLILLQKRIDFKPVKLLKFKEYAMLIGSPLIPKKDIFYEIGVYNSILGKVTSVFQHAPEIKLEITTEDNVLSEFKTSKSLLESGIFYNKFISNTELFNSIFEKTNEITNIKYYNFKPRHPSEFKDKIRITEYKIIQ